MYKNLGPMTKTRETQMSLCPAAVCEAKVASSIGAL